MTLAKFRVCGQVLMIDRALLVSKSKYFQALLDGPMQATANADDLIDLHETDPATLAQLFFTITRGVYSKIAESDEHLRDRLESMAEYYFVNLPPHSTTRPTLRTYRMIKAPRFIDSADAKRYIDGILNLGSEDPMSTFPYDGPLTMLLIHITIDHDYKCIFLKVHADVYNINLVSDLRTYEMEARHPGFSKQFVEVTI